MLAAELAFQLLLLICIGIFARKRGIVKGDFDSQLSSFILKIALPCLIIKSLNVEFEPSELLNCAYVLLLSLMFLAVEFIFAEGAYLALKKSATARIVRFGMMFTNFTFVGMPVVEALYGQQGLFYFVIFQVPMRMIYYSVAKPMLSPPGLELQKESFAQKLKGWFSPPVIAVFIGLFLYITQIQLPTPISGVINSVGSVCSPLGMILCGISLGKYEFGKLLNPKYVVLPLVRLVALPALFFVITRMLPISPMMGNIVVICSALPIASLLSAFIIQYDKSPEAQFESAGGVLISTLLCAVTIPIWAHILSM